MKTFVKDFLLLINPPQITSTEETPADPPFKEYQEDYPWEKDYEEEEEFQDEDYPWEEDHYGDY